MPIQTICEIQNSDINDSLSVPILKSGSGKKDATPRFTIVQENSRFVDRFNFNGEETIVRINETPDGVNVISWLELTIKDLFAFIMRNSSTDQIIGLSIRSNNFARGSAGISFRPAADLSYETLWELISSVCQSQHDFIIDDSFTVSLTRVFDIRGSGRNKLSDSVDSASKKSIVITKIILLTKIIYVFLEQS